MRHVAIATLAPLALLISAGAHAAPPPSQPRLLCAADIPTRCQPLAALPASATTSEQAYGAQISVANCMAMDSMDKLTLKPTNASLDALDHAARPSIDMLDEVIAHGDTHNRDVAQAAKADLLHGMAIRIRRVSNDPRDRHGLEARLASWQRGATAALAQGDSCPMPKIAS